MSNLPIKYITEPEQFQAHFQISCKICGSREVQLDFDEPEYFSEETGWNGGYLHMRCKNCGTQASFNTGP